MIPELFFLERDTPEWKAAWSTIAQMDINQGQDEPTVCKHPEYGEVWQYMATVWEKGRGVPWEKGRGVPGHAFHEFRHRMHPATEQRVIRRVSALPGWQRSVKELQRRSEG